MNERETSFSLCPNCLPDVLVTSLIWLAHLNIGKLPWRSKLNNVFGEFCRVILWQGSEKEEEIWAEELKIRYNPLEMEVCTRSIKRRSRGIEAFSLLLCLTSVWILAFQSPPWKALLTAVLSENWGSTVWEFVSLVKPLTRSVHRSFCPSRLMIHVYVRRRLITMSCNSLLNIFMQLCMKDVCQSWL